MRRRTTPWTIAVPVVAVAAGVMFGLSAASSQGDDLRPEQGDLAGVVRQANWRVENQQRAVDRLQGEIDALAKSGGGKAAQAAARADAQAKLAGFTPVTGAALSVTLDDSKMDPARLPADGNLNWLVVHQQDVQSVVNALWRGGATAMMIQDQRVISTSAVRCVGNTLLLQGRVYSPPFTIKAIGDRAGMRASLQSDRDVSNYRDYVHLVGLGYDVTETPEQTFPAYVGSPALHYAKGT